MGSGADPGYRVRRASSLASAQGNSDVATFWHIPGPKTSLIWNVLRSEGRSDVNLALVSSTTYTGHIPGFFGGK